MRSVTSTNAAGRRAAALLAALAVALIGLHGVHAAGTVATTTSLSTWSPSCTAGSGSVCSWYVGDVVEYLVHVASQDGTVPAGTVTIWDGQLDSSGQWTAIRALGTVTLDSNGGGYLDDGSLSIPPSLHAIHAIYNGDAAHAYSSSPDLYVSPQLNQDGITVTPSQNPGVAAQPVTFSIAVSGITSAPGTTPTGTVSLYDDGALAGSATLVADSGSSATTGRAQIVRTFMTVDYNTYNAHQVNVSYSGDSMFASNSSSMLYQVQPAASAVSVSASPATPTVGQAVTLTAGVTGANPSGTVSFTDGGTLLGSAPVGSGGQASLPVSSFTVGTHSIQASYGGDPNNSSSVSPVVTLTVQPAATTTAVSASAGTITVGQSLTFTAVVSGAGPVPGGSVTFWDGSASLGTAAVDPTGSATLAVATLSVGTHSISASYAGDASHTGSTSPSLTVTVQKAATTTTLTASATTVARSKPVTFTAAVSAAADGTPTGQVAFYAGSTLLSTVTLSPGGVATCTTTFAAGTYVITAEYLGDATHAPSSASLTETVTKH